MTTDAKHKQYICPGESYAISRSVHLARLASFYPPCRECPYRVETGQLPARTVQRLQQTERRIDRPTLFTSEGVRGVYINELSRAKGANITAAFAALLLENAPLVGRIDSTTPPVPRQPPVVVVGSDQRPSSPDIATGAISALRRMGCAVVDIGPTTKPCLWFNVRHLQAAAGVMVTGSGCDPSWTGLDFVAAGGKPISMLPDPEAAESDGLTLNQIERLAARPVTRASRSAGAYHTHRGQMSYEAGLSKHFHALRPLRVVAGSPARLVQRTLKQLFAPLPCRLFPVDLPNRARSVSAADDADVIRIANSVAKHNAHLGILIDDDGLRCGFVDERGRLVSPIEVTRLLAAKTENATPVAIEREAAKFMQPVIDELGGRLIPAESSLASTFDAMQRHHAEFAGGDSGRFWFFDSVPTCDAMLTVANVLKALSETDATFSEVVGGLRAEG